MDQFNFPQNSQYYQPLRCENFLNPINQVIPWQVPCELTQPFRPIAEVGRKLTDAELIL